MGPHLFEEKQAMPGRSVRATILALCLGLAMAAGPALPVSAALPALPGTGGAVPTLAPLLKQITPAVVNIAVRSRVTVNNPLLNDPFFRRFFDIPDPQLQRETRASGS